MAMSAVVAARTPHYVLMDENCPIGPQFVPLPSGIEYSAVYGFSDKRAYEKFCENHQSALKPYPLVKGYLRNQVATLGGGLKLVVLDAPGPRESCLHTATMEAVLEAQENRTTHVTTEYQLRFDQEANAYRVEESAV